MPIQNLLRCCEKFHRSQQGAVSLVAGLSAVALVSVAGAAVDEVRLTHAASSLQTVLDGAALAAVAPLNMTDAQRIAAANAYLDSQMGSVQGYTKTRSSVSIKGNRVHVKGEGTVFTAFMRVV